MRVLRTFVTAVVVAAVAVTTLVGCGPSATPTRAEVAVPADAPTITAALKLVSPGGVIEIAAGHYDEQVVVDTPDVTIRGADRNATVIDGGGLRPYGIVVIADGVRIENLTVAHTTFYGILITGLHDGDGPAAPSSDGYSAWDPDAFPPLQRFLVDHVTAHNNGLYGIYAFNAQHGVIRDSYASGSSDSGFYVGQCENCDILVTGNVAERNAVGFENANASDSVVIVGNRFSGNRVGMTLLSSYPRGVHAAARQSGRGQPDLRQRVERLSLAGRRRDSRPGSASRGQQNVFERNRMTGNTRAAVILTNTEDLAALDNRFVGNVIDDAVGVANLSAARTPASGNCWLDAVLTVPQDLAAQLGPACEASGPQSAATALDGPAAPAGVKLSQGRASSRSTATRACGAVSPTAGNRRASRPCRCRGAG